MTLHNNNNSLKELFTSVSICLRRSALAGWESRLVADKHGCTLFMQRKGEREEGKYIYIAQIYKYLYTYIYTHIYIYI